MMKSRLFKNTIFSLVTILAIFCVSNVKAARTPKSLADSNDLNRTVSPTATKMGKVSGVTCQNFTVSRNGASPIYQGIKKGPYITDQGNIIYDVKGTSAGCASSYTSFCLDPGRNGVNAPTEYVGEAINMKTDWGKRVYGLYLVSKGHNLADPTEYFAFEMAARSLCATTPSCNQVLRYHTWYANPSELASHGTSGALALQYYNDALNRANSMGDIGSSVLGIRLNKIGGYTANANGSYGLAVNAVIENCESATCASWGDMSFNMPVTQQGQAVYDANAKTLTFTLTVDGITSTGGANCQKKELTVSLKNNSEARNALLITAKKHNNLSELQRYVVFAGGNADIKNSLILDNCGENKNEVDACPIEQGLVCDEYDRNFVVINEGSDGSGVTNWEGCIIGHTDTQGNTYDVVRTTGRDQNANADYLTDEVLGYTTYGEEIKDANYCVVSCKEKYAFILPGNKKEVKQGTYFSFDVDNKNKSIGTHAVVGVGAERLCVSSSIDKGNFTRRVIDLRKQQIDYLNMYLYYKQLYSAILSKTAMNNYKNDARLRPNCEYDSDEPDRDEYERSRSCSEILSQDFSNAGALDSWDGSRVSFNIKYYKLTSEGDLRSDLKAYTDKGVTLNKSFREAFPETSSRLGFYSSRYSDYAVFDTKFNASENKGTYQGDKSRYHYEGYNEDEDCFTDDWGRYRCETEKEDEVDEDFYAEIGNYANGSENWDWNSFDIHADLYSKYRESLDKIKNAYKKAKEKYDALTMQIQEQASSMAECTNYLINSNNQDQNPYNFNPIISFSYPDQQSYMAMLAPNKLENMHDGEPTVNYETYFCASDPGSAEGVFHCGNQINTFTEFNYGDIFSSSDSDSVIDNINSVKDNVGEQKLTKVGYYDVARVGSRATYGRYTSNGDAGCTSGYVNGLGGEGNYCYEFYQSAKQFYTQAPDGLVSTDPSGPNKTILDTDGRVYPVAINTPAGTYPYYVSFANIGQYNESSTLGRIMGGGDNAPTMSGDYGDTDVCFYEVCRFDDEECQKSNPTCAEIIKNDCNNGDITDPVKFNDDDYVSCFTKLVQADCCSDAETYKEIRHGKYNKVIPSVIADEYEAACPASNMCSSFVIVSEYSSISNLSDRSFVNNDGALQVNARAVSLNNLFPNEQKGINWNTSDAQSAITEIESIGDGIFSGDPEYHVTMDATCAAAIRQYNNQEAGDSSGYGNGGFNDYTSTVTDATLSENTNIGEKGRIVVMSDSFRELLEHNCQYTSTVTEQKLHDDNKDSSRVKS